MEISVYFEEWPSNEGEGEVEFLAICIVIYCSTCCYSITWVLTQFYFRNNFKLSSLSSGFSKGLPCANPKLTIGPRTKPHPLVTTRRSHYRQTSISYECNHLSLITGPTFCLA